MPTHSSSADSPFASSHARSSSTEAKNATSCGISRTMGLKAYLPGAVYTRPMTRDELILRTRQLIAEGERLARNPSLGALQTWLQRSDDLLATAWGTMDRYHLAWLMVGKPKGIVRGREMTADETAAYVREVAGSKTAALRMSLDAVERQAMPFRGETGGIGAGQGMGTVPAVPGGDGLAEDDEDDEAGADDKADSADDEMGGKPDAAARPTIPAASHREIPLDPGLRQRLDEVRRAAADHAAHDAPEIRRAPRPERLQR